MSRSESQAPSAGRRRSNTVQSVFTGTPPPSAPPPPPLKNGDTRVLTVWLNEPPNAAVKLNHRHWPGVAEGDLICIASPLPEHAQTGFLFVVPPEEQSMKHQLQISLPKPVLDKFGLKSNSEVLMTKVDKETFRADYVELVFQDQYLGRNDMWRLGRDLVGQCLYVEQQLSFIGIIAARVKALYIDGRKVSSAYVSPSTKVVYRSLSAKVTIFIQVCRELWEFAGDGERYNEKIVHSFLPALFEKWCEMNTNHIVTIVLISRVYYDHSEIDYAAGPLRKDEEGRWYKDFFKVITDLEVLYDWRATLVSLKDSFWAFQRDILLAHHYHRSIVSSPGGSNADDHVRLVGRISYAHDGPLLEALNLGLNATETHYIDRSLSLTGSSTIIITPGTGYFRVSKQLLRLTTTRVLDQGFTIDLVSLAKLPLHQTPIFCFKGVEPAARPEIGKFGSHAFDSLWGGDRDPSSDSGNRECQTFWWEPFWMQISFWDRQMDLPFRKDRFVARAKMHEIEMMGLLDYDVLSGIEIPYLQECQQSDGSPIEEWASDPIDSDLSRPQVPQSGAMLITREEADQFDIDVFSVKLDAQPTLTIRNSLSSSGSAPTLSSSLRGSLSEHKRSSIVRISDSAHIPPIEESPRPTHRPLSTDSSIFDKDLRLSVSISGGILSTSPSQASILSAHSSRSQRASRGADRDARETPPRDHSTSRNSATTISKFAPAWLLNTFRSGPSHPQTSPVSASGYTQSTPPRTPASLAPTRSIPRVTGSRPPQPVPIKSASIARPIRQRPADEDLIHTHRGSLHSPIGTPPRDDMHSKRRNTLISVANPPILPTNLAINVHPTKPLSTISYVQASLARRWQHLYAQPLPKHEIKWRSMVTPACLPLSVEHFPSMHELETSYDVFSYDFVYDPYEMHSFLVRLPPIHGSADEMRRAWALATMRGMVALRLAQGFQFILRPPKRASGNEPETQAPMVRRTKSYATASDDGASSRPIGAAEVLTSPHEPVYLSMSNEIHQIMYSGDAIQVRRYMRRMPRTQPFQYQCLIWPKLGEGYTELKTTFGSRGMEYGWNRLDMLVGGYENEFSESLRYWRTRFVVIPTDEAPHTSVAPTGEKLNEEEIRLLGMDKLADLFSKARLPNGQPPAPPVRFITTDLGPAHCVLDESITAQLDELHAAGPLKKKAKSERDIAEMSLPAIAKVMREEDAVPIKEHRWHGRKYPNSFTGTQFVSWLVREFRDVSNREQAAEWGVKLMNMGLFDHCRETHGFLDGHYFYILRGEYFLPMTPKAGWFSRPVKYEENRGANSPKPPQSGKRTKRRLIMSQSIIIDADPKKLSDQAESVILHYDIIHNPATCLHFEFHWVGTTARCIDDLLRQWSRTIERYGLKLVEAYVDQICDVREKNAFQSCFPIPLALPPPNASELGRRLPEGVEVMHYFESALLRKCGFVLDIEGVSHYPDQVEPCYSYRRSSFKHSQWVHRSGVAFVQVLGGSQGYLFLTNRLMAPGRIGTALKYHRPAAAAEEVRFKLHHLCSDKDALSRFYDEEITQLDPALDEPPPLRI